MFKMSAWKIKTVWFSEKSKRGELKFNFFNLKQRERGFLCGYYKYRYRVFRVVQYTGQRVFGLALF